MGPARDRTSYGSYEALLADPDVDVVYVPLPNHLHVPWAIAALEAGKHVLVEKPLGLSVADARRLVAASNARPHLKVMEAFMYRFHPQWERTLSLVADGGIGDLRTVHSFFSYANLDPADIRDQPALGGGGLMDIGCYCVTRRGGRRPRRRSSTARTSTGCRPRRSPPPSSRTGRCPCR